jgi:hypothetical protein
VIYQFLSAAFKAFPDLKEILERASGVIDYYNKTAAVLPDLDLACDIGCDVNSPPLTIAEWDRRLPSMDAITDAMASIKIETQEAKEVDEAEEGYDKEDEDEDESEGEDNDDDDDNDDDNDNDNNSEEEGEQGGEEREEESDDSDKGEEENSDVEENGDEGEAASDDGSTYQHIQDEEDDDNELRSKKTRRC